MKSKLTNPPHFLHWLLFLGGGGFLAGFLGPIIFVPEANQGPLVGIFISGPLGAAIGIIAYIFSKSTNASVMTQWRILQTLTAALVLTTVLSVMPSPQVNGYLVEIEIQKCKAPSEVTDEVIQYWERNVARVKWATARAGWKEEMTKGLKEDSGSVLDAVILRQNQIQTNQKPWNRGQLHARGWTESSTLKSFYVPEPCARYTVGSKLKMFIEYDGGPKTAKDWPPKEVSTYINLNKLKPIPSEYESFW